MEELDAFVQDWKKEISSRNGSSNECSHKSTYSVNLIQDQDGARHFLNKRTHEDFEEQLHSEEIPSTKRCRDVAVIGGPALFVLPVVGRATGVKEKDTEGKHVTPSSSSETKHEKLVEKLISDLDEINTIPFFDIQLPKEIAILIFKYLTLKDLCHCAIVSKSWKIMAEDSILWMRICHSMGYDTDSVDDYNIIWKNVVREIVLHKKKTQQNWMERICKIFTYQPSYPGCLCFAKYLDGEIILCYSNGESHIWSLSTKEPVTLAVSPATPTCAAISKGLACIGDSNGNLRVYSLEENPQQIYHHNAAEGICLVAMDTSNQGNKTIAFSSGGAYGYPFSSLSVMESSNGSNRIWSKIDVTLPGPAHFRNFQIQQLSLLPTQSTSNPFNILYSTSTQLIVQSPLQSFNEASVLLIAVGCINCFTHVDNLLLCGIYNCGYHHMSLIDLTSGSHIQTFRGHSGKIRCVTFDKDHSNYRMLSTGEDKKINLYDSSSCNPIMVLSGHASSPLLTAQFEQWKLVSGSQDGTVTVWDLRTGQELWRTQDRHPVRLCEIEDNYLIVGHIPTLVQYDNSPLHSRQRGILKVFDFSVDPFTREGLPSICSSSYDEPSASFHNLNLLLPYDSIF